MQAFVETFPRNITVIGTGGIGSRHLQSLSASRNTYIVTAAEPQAEARRLAEQRSFEVRGQSASTLECVDFEAVPSRPDAVVLATPAMGRLDLLRRVLAWGVLLILSEKVLFQSAMDLRSAVALEAERGSQVWVDHPYRYCDVFNTVRRQVASAKIEMTVNVLGVGTGCNLIHFLDLFGYVTSISIERFVSTLDLPVHQSKRGEGIVEFRGQTEAFSKSGSRRRLNFEPSATAPGPTDRHRGSRRADNHRRGYGHREVRHCWSNRRIPGSYGECPDRQNSAGGRQGYMSPAAPSRYRWSERLFARWVQSGTARLSCG